MNFYCGSVEGIVNFDTRCATFTFYTFIHITSSYIAYNAKLAFLNRCLCSLHDFLTFLQRENFCCTGHATTSIDRGKTCWQAAVHAPSCLPLGGRGCLLWWCIIGSREHNIAWPCYSFPNIPKAGAIQTANRLPTYWQFNIPYIKLPENISFNTRYMKPGDK